MTGITYQLSLLEPGCEWQKSSKPEQGYVRRRINWRVEGAHGGVTAPFFGPLHLFSTCQCTYRAVALAPSPCWVPFVDRRRMRSIGWSGV